MRTRRKEDSQDVRRPGRDGPQARQDWVHEQAETGKLLAICKPHGTRGSRRAFLPGPGHASAVRKRQQWNGPTEDIGPVGHKLSAKRSPHRTARPPGRSPRQSTPLDWQPRSVRPSSAAQVMSVAPLRPFRIRASPSNLAVCPSRFEPLGGKVRWPRKFAFRARRMRRGLRF